MMRVLFLSALYSISSFAQSTYPELLTLPRASERIKMEAKTEVSENYKNFWPIMLSSFTTLSAGIYAEVHKSDGYVSTFPNVNSGSLTPDEISRNALLADVWGASWLGVTYWMMKNYYPYNYAQREIAALPGASTSDQIIKERLAEERLASAKKVGQLMNWTFALGNIAICNNLSSRSTSGINQAGNLCMLSSILPLIVNNNWSTIYENQMDYRKRIHGPIASTIFVPSADGSLISGLSFNWTY